jgi:ATP-dependent DNA helicase RecQ
VHPKRDNPVPQQPSTRFAFKEGEAVTVRKFGEGRVVSVAGDRVTIVFPNSEVKTFMGQYVNAAA